MSPAKPCVARRRRSVKRSDARAVDDAARRRGESGCVIAPSPAQRLRRSRALPRISCVRVSRRTLNQLPAAGAVLPQLVVRAARVVAQVDVVEPGLLGRVDRRAARTRGVAAVGELDLVARARTTDRGSASWRSHSHAVQCAQAYGPAPFSSIMRPSRETLERERRVQRMRLAVGHGVGMQPARRRRRLEAAVAPAAGHVRPLTGSLPMIGLPSSRHVHDAAPGAHQAQAAEAREQRQARGDDVLDDRQVAALRVASCRSRGRRPSPARPCPTG